MTAVKEQLATRERPCDSMERQLAGGNRPQRGCHGLATRGSGTQHERWESHPPMATKNYKEKIPLESARAGAEDDSSVDNTVIDPGTKQTTAKMIGTIPETATSTPGIKLQRCSCGWAKVTSYAGLRIHQGRKKCLKEVGQGPRIDPYFLRSKSSQSSEIQQQDKNQCLQDINPPDPEEEEPSTAEPLEPSLPQLATETKIPGRKPLIKWPKSCEKKE